VDGQQYGPYTWDQLLAMAAAGRIVPETYVRRASEQQWHSSAHVPGLLARKKPATKQSVQSEGTAKKIKVAKPLAAPAGVPVGVPVGPADGSSGSIPVGQVVVAPVRGAAPVAVSVAPAAPPLSFTINTEAPSKQPSTAEDGDALPRKKGSPLVLVGVLGGTALAVAIVGIAAVAWSWSQPAAPAEDVIAAVEAATPDDDNEPPPEANPGEGEASDDAAKLQVAGGKSSLTSASTKANSKSLAAAQKVITSQTRWSNLLRSPKITINSVSMQVTSVWLAADLEGTRVEPVLPAGQAAAAADTPAESAEQAKYVFVEVRIINTAPVARRFKSWNAASATAAVLAEGQSAVLPAVPPSATASVERLGNVQVPPGQSVLDVLVFEAPAEPFESLKLALSKEALADGAKGHFAIEVPLEAMFRKRPPLAGADNAAGEGPLAANRVNRESLASGSSPMPAEVEVTSAESPPPPKVKQPPSVAEINKQIEELDKRKQAAPEPPKDPPKDAPNDPSAKP
jgi:hypothetical protein